MHATCVQYDIVQSCLYYARCLLLDIAGDGSDEECDHEDKVDEVIEHLLGITLVNQRLLVKV